MHSYIAAVELSIMINEDLLGVHISGEFSVTYAR